MSEGDVIDLADGSQAEAAVAPRPGRTWPAALARFAGTPRGLAVVCAVPALTVVVGTISWLIGWRLGVDSAVYRSGAIALLHGQPLYDATTLDAEPWWALLPFTYPPTAALLFVPLTVMPTQVAWGVLGALSLLGMALVVRITLARVPRLPSWLSPQRGTVVFAVASLALEPVWRTLFLGQINLVLMVLVVVDVLVLAASTGRARRFAGVLVGVAAAVKLTPLVFVGHLLLIGRRAEAARAMAVFAGLQALMYLLEPYDFLRFWGYAVTDAGRTGPIFWIGNQSVNGLINRLSGLASWSQLAALAVAAVLAVPTIAVVRRFHRRGNALYALLASAFFGLLVSPVSWSHHYVWAVPLLVALVARLPDRLPAGSARVRALAGPVATALVFASGVLLWAPNGRGIELRWQAWEYLPGSAYMLVPVVTAVAVLARFARRPARSPAEEERSLAVN